jgi:integrase
MPNRAVSIYERIKRNGKNSWLRVEIPQRKPTTGGLYLKDDKRGDFYISWYEGKRKRFKKVKGGRLGLAVSAAEGKSWELLHPERVKEEVADDERLTLGGGIYRYLEQMAGDPKTINGHRHTLEEFQKWSTTTFVEQITRAELLRFKEWLQKNRSNDELTAVWKLIRINKFYKWAMGKGPGEGLIKTTEFKSVLNKKPKIEVYSADELKRFFAACNPVQFVLFQLFYKCGMRNKELAHLEWSDIEGRMIHIRRKRMLNGEEKKSWGPKHGSEGVVVMPSSLIPLLEDLQKKSKCNLVFPTRNGRVNIKLLDQCKLVARRAGLPEDKWKIKSFRATFATNRIRNKYDLPTIREQLRHRDLKSIEHYLDYVKNEELIATGKVDSGWDS